LVGGTPPYSGTIVSGALPAGITFDPSTMTLNGTPLEPGPFNAVMSFTDAASHVVRLTENLKVIGPSPSISIFTNADLGAAAAGASYSLQFLVSGASSYAFSIVSGGLPPGLTLSPSSGVLSGVPTTPGVYSFVLRAADATFSSIYGQRWFTIR